MGRCTSFRKDRLRFAFRDDVPASDEARWALGRLPDRIYINRSFPLNLPASRDHGRPARYVVKVFDEPAPALEGSDTSKDEWTEEVVHVSPAGRKQIKLQVAGEAGAVRQIELEEVVEVGGKHEVKRLLRLGREDSGRLIDLVKALDHIPVDRAEETIRLDDQTVHALFANPEAIVDLYARAPETFRQLIQSDTDAEDVVAIAHRKAVVDEFHRLLEDQEVFAAAAEVAGGREHVWQQFLETNPWILGVSLSGQLLQSWDHEKLEQVVAGASIAGPGKRSDALLRTGGRIRSMVFAEIKHHQTELLAPSEYRPGCYPPSREVVGGVTQVQQTVDIALREIGQRLADLDDEGAETGEATWLIRPRSFLNCWRSCSASR